MAQCKCGNTKDVNKQCDGSHKNVKRVPAIVDKNKHGIRRETIPGRKPNRKDKSEQ